MYTFFLILVNNIYNSITFDIQLSQSPVVEISNPMILMCVMMYSVLILKVIINLFFHKKKKLIANMTLISFILAAVWLWVSDLYLKSTQFTYITVQWAVYANIIISIVLTFIIFSKICNAFKVNELTIFVLLILYCAFLYKFTIYIILLNNSVMLNFSMLTLFFIVILYYLIVSKRYKTDNNKYTQHHHSYFYNPYSYWWGPSYHRDCEDRQNEEKNNSISPGILLFMIIFFLVFIVRDFLTA